MLKPSAPQPRAPRPQKSTQATSALSGPAIAKLPSHIWAMGILSMQLVQRYPVPLVGAFWIILLLIGLASMDSLVSPGLKDHSASSEQQLKGAALDSLTSDSGNAQPSEAISPQVLHQKSRIPLGLFGAIVLTGAGSAILLSTQLPRSTPRQRQPQRSPQPRRVPVDSMPMSFPANPRQAAPVQAAPVPVPRHPAPPPGHGPVSMPEPQQFARQPSPPVHPRSKSHSLHSHSLQPRSSPQPAAVKLPNLAAAPFTPAAVPTHIVPTQDPHPLDGPEGSLVDAVDLRRQRSLLSWLNQHPNPTNGG